MASIPAQGLPLAADFCIGVALTHPTPKESAMVAKSKAICSLEFGNAVRVTLCVPASRLSWENNGYVDVSDAVSAPENSLPSRVIVYEQFAVPCNCIDVPGNAIRM